MEGRGPCTTCCRKTFQSFCVQALVQPLHSAVGARLAAGDQDLEVKDAAISCTAASVALLGDVLSAQVPATLQVCPLTP